MNDHDILIALRTDMKWLKKAMSNHLKHHFMTTLCSISAAVAAIVAIGVAILN